MQINHSLIFPKYQNSQKTPPKDVPNVSKQVNSKAISTLNQYETNIVKTKARPNYNTQQKNSFSSTIKSNLWTDPEKLNLSLMPSIKRQPANLPVTTQPNSTKKRTNSDVLQQDNKRQKLHNNPQTASKTAKLNESTKAKLILSSFPSIKREPQDISSKTNPFASQPKVNPTKKRETTDILNILPTPSKRERILPNFPTASKTSKLTKKNSNKLILSSLNQPKVSNLSKQTNSIVLQTPRQPNLPNNSQTVFKTSKIASQHWTRQDCKNLILGVKLYGYKWKLISKKMLNEKFNRVQCMHKFMYELHPNLIRGKWSNGDVKKLLRGVELYGEKKWTQIAWKMFNWTRSDNDCRRKYLECSAEIKGKWSYKNREALSTLRNAKLSWEEIGRELKRGPNNCKKAYDYYYK